MKQTVTLECEHEPYVDEEGSVYLRFAGNDEYYGNVESSYLHSLHWFDDKLRQKIIGKRFRTFVQEDGEIGLEISFLPGLPFGEFNAGSAHLKAIWDNTRLHEVMTYEEYISELSNDAAWVERCFGVGGDMYAVVVEVTKPGRSPENEVDDLLPKPLWIQRKGAKYNVHIGVWED